MEETSKRRKEALGDMGPLWTDGHDGAGCSEEAICFYGSMLKNIGKRVHLLSNQQNHLGPACQGMAAR